MTFAFDHSSRVAATREQTIEACAAEIERWATTETEPGRAIYLRVVAARLRNELGQGTPCPANP